jgi:asparaginyl-tRNA synthetase
MTYDEAIAELEKKGVKLKWGEDLGTEEERILTTDKKVPIIMMKYPKGIKAFYMKVDEKNPKVVLNNDVLAPEGYGEIVGASQREENLEVLIQKIKDEGNDPKEYAWYLDLRRYGSIPHSGFGLGVERLVRWICKQEHIRDAIPFPRVLNRAYP